MNYKKYKIFMALTLVLFGVVGRFILVEYVGIPNFEIVTALSLVAGIYLGGFYSAIVPLSIIFLSDLAIGNNYIFLFTWSAFAFIGILGMIARKLQVTSYKLWMENNSLMKFLFSSVGLGIVSSVFFFIYTNFGWWLLSGMYEHNLSGLSRCYWMAIPFFRNNLIGNMIFVPMFVYAAEKFFIVMKNSKNIINKNEKLQKHRRCN